jgi:hypothetical protein
LAFQSSFKPRSGDTIAERWRGRCGAWSMSPLRGFGDNLHHDSGGFRRTGYTLSPLRG